MNLNSSNPPIYLPEKDQTSVLRLGFENCALEDWISPVSDLGTFHEHKRAAEASLEKHCLGETQSTEESQGEFHEYLLDHLLRNPRLGYSRRDGKLIHDQENLAWELGPENLWEASLWVPEDFCLLEKERENPVGQYIMTAASVCSPSNWILEEKIGRTVDFIHEPVPNYAQVLAARVNRFLEGMGSGRVLLRFNWSIQNGNELFWRDDLEPAANGTDGLRDLNATGLYWRVERQTFLRLPRSGAIVFGIRIFLHSFAELRKVSGFDSWISQLMRQLPAEEKLYKGL